MPTRCECGKPFSVDHSLNCLKEGFPTLRHNEVQDATESLLSEVCRDVRVEPHIQPLTGETMRHRTANTDEEARSDISTCGFWGSRFKKVSIPMPNRTATKPLQPVSDNMSKRRGTNTTNV